MASNPNYVKKQIALDTVSWTAVVAPVDCLAVSIKNSVLVDLRIRTDSADAATQDTISAGSIETVSAPRHSGGVQDGGSGTRQLVHASPASFRPGLLSVAHLSYASGLRSIFVLAAIVAAVGGIVAVALVRKGHMIYAGEGGH